MSYLLAILRKPGYNPIMSHPRHSVRVVEVSQLETASADERRTQEAASGNR